VGEKNWMKNVIFFDDIRKFRDALDYFEISDFANMNVPVKLHMGEKNNKFFTKPVLVKYVVNELKKLDIDPYLFDTTVAYNGLRFLKKDYKKLAEIHGFTYEKIGCNIVIDDMGSPIMINNYEYDVAEHIFNSTHIFAITHVKGHVATGMGGAIKNFGMGGVIKETKIWMHHGSRPIYNNDKCSFCASCEDVCPFDALVVKDGYWYQNIESCFGCGVCVDACELDALSYKIADLQYLLACSAKACIMNKNVIFFNEIKRISKSCDCDPFADPIICPDIGYLLSDDCVAIDKASLDLINDVNEDVFERENHINPYKQIKYGEQIGLGSPLYNLVEI
jgi:uncharacterized Fe-S center protein